jgi:hypothetical protein
MHGKFLTRRELRVAAFRFAAFSTRFYPSAYATIEGGAFHPPDLVRAGRAPYNVRFGTKNRWGDYSGMSLDPADEDCFWAFNEYAGSTDFSDSDGQFGSWKTAWARLCYPSKPKPCRKVSQSCSKVSECCVPANLCAGPAGGPKTCRVRTCRGVGRQCSSVKQCCAPTANKVCEGRPGGPKSGRVCRAVGKQCTRSSQCCSPADKVWEARRGNPKVCKVCRRRSAPCARTGQCCRGLQCRGRRFLPQP